MYLDSFGNSLAVEYIFLALGPIKQLLLASKSVPYYPKLSLSTRLDSVSEAPPRSSWVTPEALLGHSWGAPGVLLGRS